MANSLFDETGMVDTGGDGFRELPNGEKITPSIRFANPGLPGVVVELAASGWAEVGVQTTVKEVTPDECRSAPLVITLDANERWVPPFSSYFGHLQGMLWAEWVESGGAAGV